MKKTKVVSLRIPENLDELATLSAQEQHTDKATALRQWIHQGAAHYVLRWVAEGRMSMSRAAELLELTIYDLYHLAETHGIELGAADEQRQRSRTLAARLGKGNRLRMIGARSPGMARAVPNIGAAPAIPLSHHVIPEAILQADPVTAGFETVD